jgi:hypothetical protein
MTMVEGEDRSLVMGHGSLGGIHAPCLVIFLQCTGGGFVEGGSSAR